MIARDASAIDAALRRIEADDASLQAWAFIAPGPVDMVPADGPLAGMPFGVKDIIDVAQMPTAFGLWREHRKARLDAWCVAVLRAAGAVPVGKTRTTAHAYRDPAPTLNPLDPARTPGGSSAGSAAAVAAGHVEFALGTQTIGSILRPAAYCGVVGFKPTWGRIPMNGVAPFAPSLDHVGVIAANVRIATAVMHELLASPPQPPAGTPVLAIAGSVDESHEPVSAALETLRAAGIALARVALPEAIERAPDDTNLIAAYEAHAVLGPLTAQALPPELGALLQRGAEISRDAYAAARERRAAARPFVDAVLAAYDAVIVPCGDAAPSRSTTGDGAPFAAWSLFGTPAVSLPIPGTAPAARSLQLVAAPFADERLLRAAASVEQALAWAKPIASGSSQNVVRAESHHF